ncbi:MAG: LPS export ABC transporter permease LptF [Rhodobacteraceae bacterium]|nr:LPS export ABC transporter permease LptF [Paracoccaceae bacterium]
MKRFDRYMLWQLLVAFGFFALVMVGVFWVSRSVTLFDTLIRGGQPVIVFLEFSALTLPTLIRTVAPVAAFVATLYVINRMSRESEIIVMIATGASPWQLARPVLLFGLVVAVMMSLLTWVLRPLSVQQLELRESEVARDITAQLLTPGEFIHPISGVTLYLRDLNEDGTLRDVFISDQRDPKASYTFMASEAFILRTRGGVSLVMLDGLSLQQTNATNSLATTRFEDVTYDITEMVLRAENRGRSIRAVPTLELMQSPDALVEEGFRTGEVAAELHERISLPLMCISVAMVAFATLMLGSFSRFGLWPQLLGAFALLIGLEALRSFMLSFVSGAAELWALAYVPLGAGIALAALFLRVAGRPLWRRSADAAETTATPV